jgi:hypothetical protein
MASSVSLFPKIEYGGRCRGKVLNGSTDLNDGIRHYLVSAIFELKNPFSTSLTAILQKRS